MFFWKVCVKNSPRAKMKSVPFQQQLGNVLNALISWLFLTSRSGCSESFRRAAWGELWAIKLVNPGSTGKTCLSGDTEVTDIDNTMRVSPIRSKIMQCHQQQGEKKKNNKLQPTAISLASRETNCSIPAWHHVCLAIGVLGRMCLYFSKVFVMVLKRVFIKNYSNEQVVVNETKNSLVDWARNMLLSVETSSVGNCGLSWPVLFNPLLQKWPRRRPANIAGGWGVRVKKKTCHWTEIFLKTGACKYFSAARSEVMCLRRRRVGRPHRKGTRPRVSTTLKDWTTRVQSQIKASLRLLFCSKNSCSDPWPQGNVHFWCQHPVLLLTCPVPAVLKASEESYNGGKRCPSKPFIQESRSRCFIQEVNQNSKFYLF